MMNRETAIRQGFFEALQSVSIIIPGEGPLAVPVYSNKNESDETLYALITSQFAQNRSDMAVYRWKSTLEIEIYHVQQNSATFDYVDLVSDKIEEIVLPPITGNGLVPQTGWQFHALQLESVNSMQLRIGQNKARITVLKSLQFSLIISKI